MSKQNFAGRTRLTQRQKYANNNKWYKEQCDRLDSRSFGAVGFGGVDEYQRMQVNYDLFNNIIDPKDFEYVCQPYGAEVGELPAQMANRDIVSGKIKVLLGMEMKMPFSWKVVAVNEEATTRKEQLEMGEIKKFVTNEILKPLRLEIEKEKAAQNGGRQPTREEMAKIQQEIDQELKARTPDEVRKYMLREHQDPAEVMMSQILEYLVLDKKVAHKFNKGFKHLNLAGKEIYWVGIINGEPDFFVVNPKRFDYERSDDEDFIENAGWASYELRLSPSNVIKMFGSELTTSQIDRIYNHIGTNPSSIRDEDFSFNTNSNDDYTLRVLHTTWIDLMKIGFLTYRDKTGKIQLDLVNEEYILNPGAGDISLRWEWVPQAHEAYKILDDIYVHCRPVPGQVKTLDNLWEAHINYYGAAVDDLNSVPTAPMDRMKAYQYYYNIILYRIELMMASDKGKILVANIKSVPTSAGIDIEKFQYFMEANHIAYLNPNEEGNRGGGDVTNMVKEVDLSLASDIAKYINIAEYIDKMCGRAIGVTEQMEGLTGPNEAVSNTRQNITQSSHIIQPYFEMHNTVKGNVLNALVQIARVAYADNDKQFLHYVVDDLSYRMIKLDKKLLEGSKYGLFIANSSKAYDAKKAVEGLAQAALQNQQADLSDIIKVIRADSITEAEELLEAAKLRNMEEQQSAEMNRSKQMMEIEEQKRGLEREKWEHEKEIIILKAKEDRRTKKEVAAITALGFSENKDEDSDGVPDVMEVAKYGLEAEIKREQLALDREKFEADKAYDQKKLKQDDRKLQIQASKPKTSK